MLHELDFRELGCRLFITQMRQQHATERGAVGWQAASDSERDRHDSLRRSAGDVDDRAFIEYGNRGGLAEQLAHFLQHRLRRNGYRSRGQVGIAQIQDSGLQEIRAAVGGGVAELTQCVEAPSHYRPRQARRAAYVGDREASVHAGERPNDMQTPRERGHEVRIAASEEGVIGVGGAHHARRDKRTGALRKCLGVQHGAVIVVARRRVR